MYKPILQLWIIFSFIISFFNCSHLTILKVHRLTKFLLEYSGIIPKNCHSKEFSSWSIYSLILVYFYWLLFISKLLIFICFTLFIWYLLNSETSEYHKGKCDFFVHIIPYTIKILYNQYSAWSHLFIGTVIFC